MSEPAINMGGF